MVSIAGKGGTMLASAMGQLVTSAGVVALGGNLLGYFGFDLGLITGLPIAPFELGIGIWLLATGSKRWEEAGTAT